MNTQEIQKELDNISKQEWYKPGYDYTHIVILNFNTQKVDSIRLEGIYDMDIDESDIEQRYGYPMENCQWMLVNFQPSINQINY